MEALHSVPTLYGCIISISGVEALERQRIAALITSFGGTFLPHLTTSCTHLIINLPPGTSQRSTPKVHYAIKWGVPLVRPEWLYESVTSRICLEDTSYLIDPKLFKVNNDNNGPTQSFIYGDLTAEEVSKVIDMPPYLEGLHIYIGDQLPPERLALLKRLVLVSGGTRHSDLYDHTIITHFIVHNQTISPRELDQLRLFGDCLPIVVHDQWLFACFYARERLQVESFTINVATLISPSTTSNQPSQATPMETPRVKNTSWSLRLSTIPVETPKTLPPMARVVDKLTSPSTESIIQMPLFSGLSFGLAAELEVIKAAQITDLIERHGGQVITSGVPEYFVAPLIVSNFDRPDRTVTMVNDLWLETCLNGKFIVDATSSLFYQPIRTVRPIEKCEFSRMRASISGFAGIERDYYSRIITSLGATYTDNLSKKNTHLVLAVPVGPKYEFAKAIKTIICVNAEWLLSCAREGRLLPDDRADGEVALDDQKLQSLINLKGKENLEKTASLPLLENEGYSSIPRIISPRKEAISETVSNPDNNSSSAPGPIIETPLRMAVKQRLKEAAAAAEPTGLTQPCEFTSKSPPKKMIVDLSTLLKGFIFAISQRLWHRREEIHDLVVELGGVFVWSYDASCTHYIHQGNTEEENFREFRTVRQAGKWIVSPWWLLESKSMGKKLAEVNFPHTFTPGSAVETTASPLLPSPPTIMMPLIPVAAVPVNPPVIDFDSLIAADRNRRDRPMISYNLSADIVQKAGEESATDLESSKYSRVFAFSGLSPDQRVAFPRIIIDLGAQALKSITSWESTATHLVIGTLSKSEKFLAACAAGAWILKPEYVESALQENRLPEEHRYEWQPSWSNGDPLAKAPKYWREARLRGVRPFGGWIVLLATDQKRLGSLRNILLAGGALVYTMTDDLPGEQSITHVLTSSSQMRAKIPNHLADSLTGKFHSVELIADHLLDVKY